MARTAPIESLYTPLTDDVVVVRRRRESDLDVIAAASHDPVTLRWLDDPPMDAEARRTSLSRVDEAWRSGRAAPMVIAAAATELPVGIINVQFRDDDRATVAYNVFPEHRGHGFAPRAVMLVTRWALVDLALPHLYLEADQLNAASIRVAEKCGFERFDAQLEEGPGGEPLTRLVFRRSAV
jgi:RimJ/RimL family protein N-acetyltransferase